jgi:hypothetical protein
LKFCVTDSAVVATSKSAIDGVSTQCTGNDKKQMTTIPLPQNLSLLNALNFCNRLWRDGFEQGVVFDCERLKHVEPFTMAYVSAEISRFARERQSISVTFANYEHHTFAAHMGFFKAAGLNHGNEPGEAKGSSTYIPLTILRVRDLEQEAASTGRAVGDVLEVESARLAKILTRSESGQLVDTVTFSLREIMRNVVEHSGSDVLEFCAQYWPTKKKVEIVVLDSGMGIRASLSKNPFLQVKSDRDAVHLALMPAISGKTYKGVRRRSNDVWQNSGFGLYMTNRLCRNGGNFFVCSGDTGLILSGKGKTDVTTSFCGTAIRLVLNTGVLENLAHSLERYRKEGFAIAKKYDPANPIEPSIASTMLYRDFKADRA